MENLAGKYLAEALQAPFDPEELEWKVQRCGKNNGKIWALVVPYVKTGALRDRLDALLGPENWKSEKFEPGADGGLQCGLSLRINGEWITKWDGAQNTEYEAVKGGMSDAFKRTARVWGIGRYLERVGGDFAEVSPAGKFKGKTKEGERFCWNPPGLPPFCFPGQQGKRSRHSVEDLRRQADELLEQEGVEDPKNGGGNGNGNGQPSQELAQRILAMIQETKGYKYNGQGAFTHYTKAFYACEGEAERLQELETELSIFLDRQQAA